MCSVSCQRFVVSHILDKTCQATNRNLIRPVTPGERSVTTRNRNEKRSSGSVRATQKLLRKLDKWLRRRIRELVFGRHGACHAPGSPASSSLASNTKTHLDSDVPAKEPGVFPRPQVSNRGCPTNGCRTRIVQSVRKVERACSKTTNRLVRIRMLGGVGGVRRNPAPIPITLLFGVYVWHSGQDA